MGHKCQERPAYPPAGQGELDYPRFVQLLARDAVPALVIEYVTEENFAGVRDFLLGVIAAQEREG